MHLVRRWIFVAAILAILGPFAGVLPTLWAAALLAVALGLHGTAGFFGRWSLTVISVILSIIAILGGAVTLFVKFGWMPAVVSVVAYLGYMALGESRDAETKRLVEQTRKKLRAIVTERDREAERIAGSYMEQLGGTAGMLGRARPVLRKGAIERGVSNPETIAPILARDGLSDDEYHDLLLIILAHLGGVDAVALHGGNSSEMRQEIMRRIGMAHAIYVERTKR